MSTLRSLAVAACTLGTAFAQDADLRIGLIGLDTSHVVAFTRVLNDPAHKDHLKGGRVVAAYRGGSPDMPLSANRIDGFTAELKKYPEIVFHDTIASLVAAVDAVMILSVDGRIHLEQARQVLPARKPVFIDKPFAASLADAREIVRLAREHGTPLFSTSSRRYSPTLPPVLKATEGKVRAVLSYGPMQIEPNHPDLFFYGIHAVEGLYTVLGPGCVSLQRTHTADTDVVTGVWPDGRVGTVHGIRNAKAPFGMIVFGADGPVREDADMSYVPMLQDVLTFFRTGVSPVPLETTLEIIAFMEAAEESKRRGGAPVALAPITGAR